MIKSVKLVNLTPHEIVMYDDNFYAVEKIPTTGQFARAEETKQQIGQINGYLLFEVGYGALIDLPEPEENTLYIVSQITAQAAKQAGRDDCIIVTDTVRDDNGRINSKAGKIVGAQSFAKL